MKKLLFSLILVTGLFAEPILKFYCGSTMAKVMREMADKFEAENDVRIVILKGGSSKLYKKILNNKDGDLYLPGAQSYVLNDQNDLFSYKKLVGYNKAVMLVQKGNPKGITDLNDLTRKDVIVVLGAKNSGSIEEIEKDILVRFKGLEFYKKLYNSSIKAQTSLDIINALKSKQADVSISWKATAFMNNNENFVEIVNIPYLAPKQKLFLTVVKFSKYPNLAKKFVDFTFKNKAYLKKKGF